MHASPHPLLRHPLHGLALLLATSGLAVPQEPAGKEELARLAADLGSESWGRRETAQRRLLEEGLSAAEVLETAAASGNPEIAYRAQYLLSRIDPHVVRCQVLKVDLGPEARIAARGAIAGAEREDLTVRIAATPGGAPGAPAPAAPALTLTCRSLSSGAIEVKAAESGQGSELLELKPILLPPGDWRILKTGEQCLHRRMGLHLERERRPYVILVHVRQGRRSSLEKSAAPSEPAAALEALKLDLLAQTKSPHADSRLAALDCLERLGAPEAQAAFEAALADEAALPIAILGKGDPDLIAGLLGQPASADDARSTGPAPGGPPPPPPASPPSMTPSPPLAPSLLVRAAARLLERGDVRGLDPLLGHLTEGDPSQLHGVMASLADWARRGRFPEGARSRFLRAVFSDEVLGHALWEDVETEHLLAVAAGLLRPADPVDAALALRATEQIQRLATGDIGPANVRLRGCVDLRRRLVKGLGGRAQPELDFLIDALPALTSAVNVAEAVSLIEEGLAAGDWRPPAGSGADAPGPAGAPDEELGRLERLERVDGLERLERLDRLLDALVARTRAEDPGIRSQGYQGLLRIARAVPPQEGQLRRIASRFIEAAEAAQEVAASGDPAPQGAAGQASQYLRQMDELLARWAGAGATGAGAARRPPGAPAFRSEEWKAWIADEARVAAREEEMLRGAGTAAPAAGPAAQGPDAASGAPPLVYYELDVVLGAAEDEVVPGAVREEAFQILDGRRLEVVPGTPVSYEDRWGTRLTLRITKDGPDAPKQPARYRLNSRGVLFVGLPTLTSVQGKDLSLAWHETSDLFFGSRPVPGSGSSNYRTLHLAASHERDGAGPPRDAGLEGLWAWFRDNHLLKLPPEPTDPEVNGVLTVLKTLKLKGSAQLLRQLLKARPSVDIAVQLHELGDPAGLEHLRSELSSDVPLKRLNAAVAICEVGVPEGVEAILQGYEKNAALLRGHGYRIVNALDSFLQRSAPVSPARGTALDFLAERLQEPSFQHRAFSILQRESGREFGYETARQMDGQEARIKAMKAAIDRARAWREETRRGGRQGEKE